MLLWMDGEGQDSSVTACMPGMLGVPLRTWCLRVSAGSAPYTMQVRWPVAASIACSHKGQRLKASGFWGEGRTVWPVEAWAA